jgi:hypothetical protein
MFRSGQSEIEIPGRVVMTNGVAALGEKAVEEIMQKVKDFNDFTEANDPYGEHDFGRITHDG